MLTGYSLKSSGCTAVMRLSAAFPRAARTQVEKCPPGAAGEPEESASTSTTPLRWGSTGQSRTSREAFATSFNAYRQRGILNAPPLDIHRSTNSMPNLPLLQYYCVMLTLRLCVSLSVVMLKLQIQNTL